MKKLLATILALVMALSITTLSWAAEKGAEGGEAGLNEVYVSHSKGDDSKDGTTVDNAVKTLRKAMELVKENGTVMIVDTNDCDKCPNDPPCEGGKGYFFQAGSGTYITKPVTFKGVGEQRVALTGMVRIPAISGTVRFENLSFESKWNNVENKSGAPDLTLEFVNCGFPNMTGVSTLSVGTVASLTVQGCNFTVGANGYLGNYLIWGTASIITIKDNNIDGGDHTRGAINLGNGTATGTTATITGNTIKGFERGVQVAFKNKGTQNTVNISSNVFENISHKEGSDKQEREVAAVFLHKNLAAEGVKTTVTVAADNTMTNAPRTIYAEGSVTVKEIVAAPAGAEVVGNGDGSYSFVEKQPPRYYYNSTTTDTKTDTTKGSPKTFDAGVGIYAVTAVLSVTGMAWTAKKRH